MKQNVVMICLFFYSCLVIANNNPKSEMQHLQMFEGPLNMSFIQLAGGKFVMGSAGAEQGYDSDESPKHIVNVKPFQIMNTEVTQAQWFAVMNENPSHHQGDNLPVEQVSWQDVQSFIIKINKLNPGKNYRLPTEAEWEYACRAGTTSEYCNGDDESGLTEVAWFNVSESKTVGQKKANPWGLYDMHGNVWEWCDDWYHPNYEYAPDDGSAWNIPTGTHKVLRGGSWAISPRACRSAFRVGKKATIRFYSIGFRLVRSPVYLSSEK